MSFWREEKGAALLTVLMLVAVISVLATSALEKLRIATRLTGNQAAVEQARAYGMAAETIGSARISDLLSRDTVKTTLAGNWMGVRRPFPIDGGLATAAVLDGGNCFNLNSLVEGNAASGYAARPTAIAQFTALLQALDIPANSARRIAVAATDWIDSDRAPLPGGAEDEAYDAYRTANALVVDPSELRSIAGVTPELYRAIRPWVCALPEAALSPINVNTLQPQQGPLIAMLLPGQIDANAAKSIIAQRPRDGYTSMVDFWKLPALAGQTPSPDVLAQPQLKTRWFSLEVDVQLGGIELRQTSLIDATITPVKIIRRAYGDPA
jgi:general secretion pathway protein K